LVAGSALPRLVRSPVIMGCPARQRAAAGSMYFFQKKYSNICKKLLAKNIKNVGKIVTFFI
jgi:hypothetical protein